MAELLPLFPLGRVLVPGWPMPMRIFEPRYLQLLDDVTSTSGRRRFGIVSLTSGFEVQTATDRALPPQIAGVGTVAEILELGEQNDDGTVQILTGGSQRFRIDRLVESDKPYLVAEVTYLFEHPGEVPDGLVIKVQALAAELLRLLHELLGEQHPVDEPYPDDIPLLAHRLAGEAPLTLADQQSLLEDELAVDRLKHLQKLFRREISLMRHTHTVAMSPMIMRSVLGPN